MIHLVLGSTKYVRAQPSRVVSEGRGTLRWGPGMGRRDAARAGLQAELPELPIRASLTDRPVIPRSSPGRRGVGAQDEGARHRSRPED